MKVQQRRKRIELLLFAMLFVVLISGCGKKQKEKEHKETKVESTSTVVAEEETTEEETFRYSVQYNAVLDTSELSDEETSKMITTLREKAKENHMEIGLGQARYKELVLIITCYYQEESVSANEVREKLLDGLKVKTIE